VISQISAAFRTHSIHVSNYLLFYYEIRLESFISLLRLVICESFLTQPTDSIQR